MRQKLLFLTITLFLFSGAALLSGEPIWFESNSLGQGLRELPWYRINEEEWTLSYEEGNPTEKILWHDGVAEKTWLYEVYQNSSLKQESYYEDEVLQSELLYDLTGRLVEERAYTDGTLATSRVFRYQSGQLSETIVKDSLGIDLYEEAYFRAGNGSLRRVIRTYPDGETQVSEWGIDETGLFYESLEDGDITRISRYNQGNLFRAEIWNNSELLESNEFVYSEGILVSSENYSLEGSLVEREYNDLGLLKKEIYTDGQQQEIKVVEYTYNEEGLLSTQSVDEDNQIRTRTYLYEGLELVQEDLYNEDDLITRTNYRDDGLKELIYFRKGLVFLKVFYQDDTKIREEFMQNGEIIRTRDFEGDNEE